MFEKFIACSAQLLPLSKEIMGCRLQLFVFLVFFGFCRFSMGFGPVFSSFRIWIVCMRVWDRSKLQEWKQISRHDDFKQTVQNMCVSTMCAPSPPMILPSV